MKKRTETPFLKGYVQRSKSYPSYVPAWVTPAAWGLFGLLAALSVPINFGGLGLVFAGVIAWAFSAVMASRYKPATDEEQFEDTSCSAIRRLKFLFAQGIGGSVPERILLSLERAVEAYNTAISRLAVEDPIASVPSKRHLEHMLRACFVASVPMIRDNNHSRKEWRQMKENTALISQIVQAIDQQAAQMLDSTFTTRDRLAALRELSDESNINQTASS